MQMRQQSARDSPLTGQNASSGFRSSWATTTSVGRVLLCYHALQSCTLLASGDEPMHLTIMGSYRKHLDSAPSDSRQYRARKNAQRV